MSPELEKLIEQITQIFGVSLFAIILFTLLIAISIIYLLVRFIKVK